MFRQIYSSNLRPPLSAINATTYSHPMVEGMSEPVLADPNIQQTNQPRQFDWRRGLYYCLGLAVLLTGMNLFSQAFDLRLDNEQYSQSNLIIESLRHWPQLLVVAVATAILAAAGGRTSWRTFEQPRLVRLLVVALCGAIAWAYSAYAMNHFHGQLHLVSRLTLIGLAMLVYVHPAALPAFITVAFMIAHQFDGDLPGPYTWNDKLIVFEVLTLFTAYQFWKLATRHGIVLFLTACLSLVSAYYFQAGFNKATLPGWIAGNELVNFIFASHVGGWFFSSDGDAALRTLNWLRPANTLMIAGTLAIELGAVFLLSNRKVATALLCGFVMLHSLIFSLMGILFWKWICLDLCLLAVIWRLKEPLAAELFSRKNFACGVATTAGILLVLEPWGQGSLNTPLTATYRFEATGESGQRYSLSSDFFAPYDVIFAQRRFYCLGERAPIVSTFGSTKDRRILEVIQAAGPDSIRISQFIDECQANGNSKKFDPAAAAEQAAMFDRFVRKFVRAKLDAGQSNVAHRIGPFRHILQSPGGDGLIVYDWQEPIASFDVYEVQKYCDKQAIHTLRNELCHRVKIESSDQQLAGQTEEMRR